MGGELDPIVQAALARGFLTPAQLEAARELDRTLAAEGRSPGLRVLLAQRFLRPEQVAALRDAALTQADSAPGPPVTHAGPAEPPLGRARSGRTLAQGGDMAPTAADTTGVLRPLDLPAGAVLGGYRIERQIGRGGMGAVYAAVDPTTGATVAVKVMAATDRKAVERFRREGVAQAAADRHPNVLRVFASGEHQGAPFLVMELAEGGDLSKRLATGPMQPAEAAALVAQLARGLSHVHQKGVLHRDLKPHNVMFGGDGTPKLVDFGVARLRGEQDLTKTGDLLGTPAYMAPEQAEGVRGGVDERSDVYGLGAILYHAVTGRPPFEGDGMHQILKAVLMDPPAPPSTLVEGLPPAVDHVVLKALSKEPNDRYPSARALAEDLERLARGEEVLGRDVAGARRRARALRRGVAAVVLVVGVAGGGFALWRTWPTLAAYFQSIPPPPATIEPTGSLVSVHAKSTTRLDRYLIRATVTGDARATRVMVDAHPAITGAAPWDHEAHVELGLGKNVLRLEAQRVQDARWVKLDELVVTRLAAFDPAPPSSPLTDLHGRPVRFDEALEEYVAHDGSVLVYVPPGKLRMGAEECVYRMSLGAEIGEHDAHVSVPVHDVVLSRGYLIGKHEVTWEQLERWQAETRASGPRRPQDRRFGPRTPAVDVTWQQASAYCAWAGFALPTEAQWEWAARGPEGRRYPWGDEDPTPARAVFALTGGSGAPVDVDALVQGASWVGALHMAGNAWEWVRDVYMPNYSQFVDAEPPPRRDPCHEGSGDVPSYINRVIRGGSWRTPTHEAGQLHAAFRRAAVGDLTEGDTRGTKPNRPRYEQGFRVALPLP